MAGSDPNSQSNMITAINVTPLVDITLVLLIVFMVTATYIVKATIEVELPRAASGGEDVGKTLNVLIKQPNSDVRKADKPCTIVALNGTVTDEAHLTEQLRKAAVEDASAKAMISADRDCRHSEFVHVVDLVKEAGITKFSINIEKIASTTP